MKIDDIALLEAMVLARGEFAVHNMKVELSRQLTAAGAPPGDLETQLRALLARLVTIEPGADTVERVASAIAFNRGVLPRASERTEARAVLSALAGMGADALPSDDVIAASVRRYVPDQYVTADVVAAVGGLLAARLAPILAAKDAELARMRADNDTYERGYRHSIELSLMLQSYAIPSEPKALARHIERERNAHTERIRELEAQLAARPIGIPDPPPPPPQPSLTMCHECDGTGFIMGDPGCGPCVACQRSGARQ